MKDTSIEQLLKDRSGIQLDIGCGGYPQPGFVGLDIRDLPGVDIVWDVNTHPWPLPDESVIRAICSHLVEHIPPVAYDFVEKKTHFLFIEFMDEVWRILKPDAQFAIALPHGYSPGQLQDPSHINASNEATWAYFDPLEPNTQGLLYKIYKPNPWKLEHISFSPVENMEVILRKRRKDPSYYE